MTDRNRKNASPLRYTHVIQMRLNDEQFAAIKQAAAEDGVSLSTYARGAVDAQLHRVYSDHFTTPPEWES